MNKWLICSLEKRNIMDEKLNKVLDGSAEVFAKYGYKKTTMQDIGNKLCMTKSNLYLYSKNKEDLYIKSVSYQLDKWRREVEESISDLSSASEKFEVTCKRSFEYVRENEIIQKLVEQDPEIFVTNHDSDRFIEVNREAENIIKRILSEGVNSGEFRKIDIDNITEYIFSSYMLYLIKFYSRKDRYTTEKQVDDTIDLLKHGLLLKE
jgi:AcrR family transcriptional regulator